jgi:hypothetical protein
MDAYTTITTSLFYLKCFISLSQALLDAYRQNPGAPGEWSAAARNKANSDLIGRTVLTMFVLVFTHSLAHISQLQQ